MATVLDRTVQALADVTGFIVDRTVIPEQVIGQAWIISKSRMVVLASSICNYADAPWALLVKFPYPDLTFSVKAITLHPEFNKRAMRDAYLAQANQLLPSLPVLENDIATITIDAEIPDLQPDRIQELNRALSLQLTISTQDLSGVMRAGETGNILQKAIVSGRNGILNFYDERKVPFCRMLLQGGRILKATFNNLQNEFAVCELMWRKPGGNFVLQSQNSLSWGGIPDIAMSTDQLANEANRRTQDLPRMLDALGGPNARYLRTRQQIDLNQINDKIRWVVERMWPVLDGALPLTKLSERLAIDTYTALQALWEMKHLGLVNLASDDQYHRSGQLGPPLTPAHDIDLQFWDTLQGFYLDDLSTNPVTVQGNYFGSSHLLRLTQLLHTMPFPACKYGAIVLKDGRLVGLHNGKFTAVMASPPPFGLGQMTWIGCLTEMSAKRMRGAGMETEIEQSEELPNTLAGRGTITGIKSRQLQQAVVDASSSSTSLKSPTTEHELDQHTPPEHAEPDFLQKITKIQLLGASGALFIVGLLIGFSMAPRPAAITTQTPANNTSSSPVASKSPLTGQKAPDGAKVLKSVLKQANLKNTSIPPFVFTDTSAETTPKPSFGLESEQGNQKIILALWPDQDLHNIVEKNSTQPPFIPLKPFKGKVIGKGDMPSHNIHWKATRYLNKEDKETVALVAAFPTVKGDQSILLVAMPYKGEGELDFTYTLNMIERMFKEGSKQQEDEDEDQGSTQEASEEEIDAYRIKVGESIKSAYRAPLDAERANRCVVNFLIGQGGKVTKLELKYASGMDEVDKAVQKAITGSEPYPPPPTTKSGTIPVQVTMQGGDFAFTEF